MDYFIYRNPRFLWRYTVLRGKEWPDGFIVQVANTLWGARWIARRDARNEGAKRVLVEKVAGL